MRSRGKGRQRGLGRALELDGSEECQAVGGEQGAVRTEVMANDGAWGSLCNGVY